MTPKEIFEADYAECILSDNCCDSKYYWAASEVFDLTTYDNSLSELFVKKIIEVCKVILSHTTFDYIQDKTNYVTYILVCQLLCKKDWINWGTSIRGAWFDRGRNAEFILEPYELENVPFSEENLRALIEFIEGEEVSLNTFIEKIKED